MKGVSGFENRQKKFGLHQKRSIVFRSRGASIQITLSIDTTVSSLSLTFGLIHEAKWRGLEVELEKLSELICFILG